MQPRSVAAFVALLLALIGYLGIGTRSCAHGTLATLRPWIGLSSVLVGLALSIVALVHARGRRGWGGAALITNILAVASAPAPANCVAFAEFTAVGDIRTILSAQSAYARLSGGHYDTLECLAKPSECVQGYPRTGPMLDRMLLSAERQGYKRTFHPGPGAKGGSRSAIDSWAYTALPAEPNRTGIRAFCGDSSGIVCATRGEPPPVTRGRCQIGTGSPCEALK